MVHFHKASAVVPEVLYQHVPISEVFPNAHKYLIAYHKVVKRLNK